MKKFWPVLILVLILSSSCVDRKTSFLIGKWKEASRIANPSKEYIWTFKDDNNFTIEIYDIEEATGGPISVYEGEYNLDRKSFEYRLDLQLDTDISGHPVRGEYWVDELDRNNLKITREDADVDGTPFLRYEFQKL